MYHAQCLEQIHMVSKCQQFMTLSWICRVAVFGLFVLLFWLVPLSKNTSASSTEENIQILSALKLFSFLSFMKISR